MKGMTSSRGSVMPVACRSFVDEISLMRLLQESSVNGMRRRSRRRVLRVSWGRRRADRPSSMLPRISALSSLPLRQEGTKA
jgi:hypothetical protein